MLAPMTAEHTIREISIHDDDDWCTHVALMNEIAREAMGNFANVREPMDFRRQALGVPHRRRCYLLAMVGERAVGFASARTSLDRTPVSSYLEVGVLSAHRGRGIGSALGRAAMAALADHGTVRVDGWVSVVPDHGDGEAARAVARGLGFTRNAVDVVRECPLPLDIVPEVPAGYTFTVLTGEPPVDCYPDLRTLLQGMNSDVPQGETPLPVQEFSDEAIASRYDCGSDRQWLLIAHDVRGRVAGYTELGNPAEQETRHRLEQGDTIVLREHRGHGLGFAMKVAAMTRAVEDAPWLRVAQTSNDQTNTHMVAINERLGFREVARVENWTWLA